MKDIEVEPAPMTATEIEIEKLTLDALVQSAKEATDLTVPLLNAMRLKYDDDGVLQPLTEDEYLDTLSDKERTNYNNFKLQLERQERALKGDLPVSEALTDRGLSNLKNFKEAQARRGNLVTGDTLATATAFSTPAIQGLGELRTEQRLAEDAERRAEINTGATNVANQFGLLSDLEARRISNYTAFPQRNLSSLSAYNTQAGILADVSLANAQAAGQQQSDLFKLIGSGAGILAGLL